MEILLEPTVQLFNQIYIQGKIPEQLSICKIIPNFKKGTKTNKENYRPIANLCSMTKVFAQLIINHLKEIEVNNKCNLTGSA